jgi:alpha-ketoglutarate-dependent sulfate ester dioxygenase
MSVTDNKTPAPYTGARRFTMARWDVQVGPLGHLAAERERLAHLSWQHFDARPLGATIGALISGVDLTVELPHAVVAELRRALLDYKVIFFREQALTPAAHVAFARRFGELELHPFIPANPDEPELVRFAKSADVGGYENSWHSDVSWREVPSMGAVLHAVEVPQTGGDTLFADMGAAYDGLDDGIKARIQDLSAVHDYMQAFGSVVKPEDREKTRAAFPPAVHPVVRTHGETGRKLIYVNRNFTDHIVGLDADDSIALIDRLSRQADTIEYQCRFSWEPHSVAFWDNRAVQHYACSDYWPSVRVMERASVVGERPV